MLPQLAQGTTLLGGRYTVTAREVIGRGEFGVVYEVEDSEGFKYAAKFIQTQGAHDAKTPRELEVAEHIRRVGGHPNLIRVHEIGNDWGHPVVVTELAQESLAAWNRRVREQKLDEGERQRRLLHFIRQVAEGLDFLGFYNYGHHDVKPENILIAQGVAKLADFGFTKLLTRPVTDKTIGWTPTFAAPEFLEGETRGNISDQYSLAVTYHHLRTSSLPFVGWTDSDVAKERPLAEMLIARTENKIDVKALGPKEGAAVARALSRKPEDRFPSCVTFAEALEKGVETDGWRNAQGRPSVAIKRGVWAAGGLIAGLLGLLLVLLVLLVRGTPPERPDAQVPPPTGLVRQEEVTALHTRVDALRAQVDALRGGADYTTLFARALAAYRDKRFAEAGVLLDACPENERRFEYHLLRKGLSSADRTAPADWLNGSCRPLTQRDKPVESVAFSPTRERPRVGWGRSDGAVRVWDQELGERLIVQHNGPVHSVTFHPTGEWIASVGDDTNLQIYDINRKEDPIKYSVPGVPLFNVGFDTSGDNVVYAGRRHQVMVRGVPEAMAVGGGVAVTHKPFWWQFERLIARDEVTPATTPAELTTANAKYASGGPYPATFRSEGRMVATVNAEGKLLLAGLDTPSNPLAYGAPSLRAALVGVSVLAFSPDGNRLGVVYPYDGRPNGSAMILHRVRQGAQPLDVPAGSELRCLVFDPGGTRVVTGEADGTLRVWHADNGKELLTLRGHTGAVNSVAVSPDGRQVVSGGADGKVLVWGVE